jgi:REP element-mobilizing transposase RayT
VSGYRATPALHCVCTALRLYRTASASERMRKLTVVSHCTEVHGAYLITFVCYGSHLPGQEGIVDRRHNHVCAPTAVADARLLVRAKALMTQEPYLMDSPRRTVVLQACQEICPHRGWHLLAAHVRTTHLHVIVEADRSPEQVMIALKASASHSLNRMGIDGKDRRRWARHGSTRYLWTPEEISAAIHYVACNQGEAMALYIANG